MINKIIAETGVKLISKEDGRVFIYSNDAANGQKSPKMVEDIGKDLEVGAIYEGTVSKIMPFGAFIELGGAKRRISTHFKKYHIKRIEK